MKYALRTYRRTERHAVVACALLATLSSVACSERNVGSDEPIAGAQAQGPASGGTGAGEPIAQGGIGGGMSGDADAAIAQAGEGGAGDPAPPSASACGAKLPRAQPFDPARAAHGQLLLQSATLAPGILPELIIRNLWVAWGMPPPATDADFWALARARYGLIEAPFDNGGLPLGMRREAGELIAFDCMLCHGGRVAGITLLGAASTSVDLESFFDDLNTMRELAPALGIPAPPVPFDLAGLTSAPGAQDAFGLGFRFTGPLSQGANTNFGPQKPPAWWLLKHKARIYVDGSGDASSHHSMMATLVAFGVTPDQLVAREPDFLDVVHYIRSLEAPCWTLTALDAAKVTRGQALFDATCASCHGVHSGDAAAYPDQIVARAEVGTDPVRAERFTQVEADRLNASWFGEPPFEPTGGYLAQPLAGVWARAPYFHNGSVPHLLGVLDSRQRPARWRRSGVELADYDIERVGLRFEEVGEAIDPSTREGRLVYDTAREGMSNGGHLYGDALSESERADLLEYLRSL